jgi:hypothetical protein
MYFASLGKIESICKARRAVIAKEVGWGFCKEDVRRLAEAGWQPSMSQAPVGRPGVR